MKGFITFIGVILLFNLFSGCSSKPALQLINSTVSITSDRDKVGAIGITGVDKKEKEIVLTSLYYEFTIKNTSNKRLGEGVGNKGLQIKFEPSKKLETLSKEIVGFNIFNSSSGGISVGQGKSLPTVLRTGEEGEFILYYGLGVSEEHPQLPYKVPSTDKLKELQENALDASLIVLLEGREVARFDLKKDGKQ